MTHDEIFLSFKLDFASGIFAEYDGVSFFKEHLFVLGAVAYCHDSAFKGFFFGRVGDDDARNGDFFGGCRVDEHPVG